MHLTYVTEKLTPWRVTASADCSQGESTSELNHPINLSHAESRAVTPISPAAQKFHRLILCSFLDNSFIFCKSSVPGLYSASGTLLTQTRILQTRTPQQLLRS